MGRHSAPSRVKPRLKRTGRNLIAVVLVTSLAVLVLFVAIAGMAAKKNSEIPPPFVVEEQSWIDSVLGEEEVVVPPIEQVLPPSDGAASASEPPAGSEGEMRACPATGCTASTCHAETGEPIPGR